jgi:hypothetical protein
MTNLAQIKQEWLTMRDLKAKELQKLETKNASKNVADYFNYLAGKYVD